MCSQSGISVCQPHHTSGSVLHLHASMHVDHQCHMDCLSRDGELLRHRTSSNGHPSRQWHNSRIVGSSVSLSLSHLILTPPTCDVGSNSTNFTTTPDLFLTYPSIAYWRFEVLYSLTSTTGSSALNFIINQAPQNGSCSVSPPNGTTSTWFTIACSQWQDTDGIKDYSFYSLFFSFLT